MPSSSYYTLFKKYGVSESTTHLFNYLTSLQIPLQETDSFGKNAVFFVF